MADQHPSYALTMRFPTPEAAKRAYTKVERLLYEAEESELSAFNLQLEGAAIVAVVGDPPAGELHARLMQTLAAGEPLALPEPVLRMLHRRWQEQKRFAPWVERHHRPGKRVRVEDE